MMDAQQPVAFEWDDEKAARNLDKHGVSFEAAMRLFEDPDRLEEQDRRRDYGEVRCNSVGMVDGYHLTVTWTPRLDGIRIISARASREERERYDDRT